MFLEQGTGSAKPRGGKQPAIRRRAPITGRSEGVCHEVGGADSGCTVLESVGHLYSTVNGEALESHKQGNDMI